MHMNEFDMLSNLTNIVMQLPYELREKWSNVSCDLQEQHGYYLLTFIEIVLTLTHWNIQDAHSPMQKLLTVTQPKHGNTIVAHSITAMEEGN